MSGYLVLRRIQLLDPPNGRKEGDVEMGQPSRIDCDVFGLQMQPSKDAVHELRHSWSVDRCLIEWNWCSNFTSWKPVAYASRSMTENECRYAQIEKECLGFVFGLERFHSFTVETECMSHMGYQATGGMILHCVVKADAGLR